MNAAPAPAQRIVSLVPSTTQSVCELGAATRLVGCTRYCTEPAGALRDVRRVGGTKNPDREAILALEPDLVLGNGEENRAEDLEWLACRVPVATQTPRTVAAAAAALKDLARRLGCAETAASTLARVDAAVAALRGSPHSGPGLRVYYAIWRKPWMTVGRDTFVHDVLHLAGARHVAVGDAARYPQLDPATAAERGIDVVLLASEPWAFDERQRRELEAQRTFGDARLVRCDGRDFCWHGTHMAVGLPRVAALLASLAR
jgi:ABC-type Fe3+-hydroxamate transport system substrate-binding protein